mgnify:CR=1 FL=1
MSLQPFNLQVSMFRINLSLLVFIAVSNVSMGHGLAPQPPGDEARKISFPDTAEHETLVFDPHTHSVFSDGHVWPKIRVGEALRDGLDALAVTEHLEYQPHIEDIPHPDRNRSFIETAEAAKYKDLLVVAGAEITRDLPAGHMNAIFIDDANKLYSVPDAESLKTTNAFRAAANEWPSQSAVEAANEQGAFLFWNHSWWSRDFPNGIPVITDFHINNIREGLLHGIEIANGKNYSEDAFQIALDYDLALIGVSDVHDLIDWDYEPHNGGHRPVTLVFSEDRTVESMREALFDRRTVVWFKNWLMGRERDLQPLLEASLSLEDVGYRDGAILSVTVTNESDADFHLRNLSAYDLHQHAATIVVPQHSSESLLVRTGDMVESVSLEFEVLNAFVAPNETARITLSSEVE